MKPRVAYAFLLSAVLITGALWTRFAPSSKPLSGFLSATNYTKPDDPSLHEDKLVTGVQVKSNGTTTQSTGTDLIGRQLILDYVDLAVKGQATDDNLNLLAANYVNKIPTLSTAHTATYADLHTVSNTQQNYQVYADQFTKIYTAYSTTIHNAYGDGSSLNGLNPAFYKLAGTLTTTYKKTAEQLKAMTIPLDLAPDHLKLINNYLSSSAAMLALSKTNSDSSSGFAGMVTIKQNLDEEDAILNNIRQIVTSHGIQ